MYFNQLKFNCAQLRISIYLDLQLVCLLVRLNLLDGWKYGRAKMQLCSLHHKMAPEQGHWLSHTEEKCPKPIEGG